MGYIKLLDDDVINKIAAGEVVERPASVVKELIDNALDAGATKIRIELEQGGCERITIIDNGRGMTKEDAQMAVQRHATSKIKSVEDLMAINTMGFRGEALASIASVSKFSLLTRKKEEGKGTKVYIEGGAKPELSSWSGATGTSITVADLFYNVPARKAFQKSPVTELAQCTDVVQSIAILRAGVEFVMLNNDKEKLRVDAGGASATATILGEKALRARAEQTLKKDYIKDLIYLRRENQYGEIEALISTPGNERPTAKQMLMFVNERPVKDRHIRMGVLRGYHSHILKGQYPAVIISLRLNPNLVDVNVHPAKTEIRLQYASEIQSLIAMAIREQLRTADWARPEGATAAPTAVFTMGRGSLPQAMPTATRSTLGVGNATIGSTQGSRFTMPKRGLDAKFSTASDQQRVVADESLFGNFGAPEVEPETIPWNDLEYVGAVFSCYLVFSVGERMLVIDQHALHERILYERLVSDRKSWSMPQPMLVPEVVDVGAEAVENIKARRAELESFGFQMKVVGEASVEWRAVPTIFVGKDIEALTATLGLSDENLQTDAAFPDESRLILATIACHSAVRAGDDLTAEQLTQLVADARDVDFVHNCPHGRRVFKWWKKSEVERWFDR